MTYLLKYEKVTKAIRCKKSDLNTKNVIKLLKYKKMLHGHKNCYSMQQIKLKYNMSS